ncbi:hypothetical protein H4R33_003199 [Dimargaris cristalligena]|uniref:Bola-related protein n=1 Tax=Dimargaris cristalligena TaxID=215637 RepID=A0A4Q0A2W7_9FUNG|nr:hypothetical protein H4R33_003199 [Dimargaris cristalligena]RKP40417.1 bola-related protein [Dimargaris cristalligena]|eukprot:RKP40417.1 bola-related protein [Dimargaris cristalligena]
MGVTIESLKEKITKELAAEHVEVKDLSSGCGQNFEVIIVSPKFEGKRLLQRHTLVNTALKDEIDSIHAFSQTTLTPAEWATKQAK